MIFIELYTHDHCSFFNYSLLLISPGLMCDKVGMMV